MKHKNQIPSPQNQIPSPQWNGLFLIIFCLTINITSLDAAWWNEEVLPLPPAAEQIKEENENIAGSEFTYTYYASAQDASGIKDFYRNRLPNLGWKEEKLLEPQETGVLKENLSFAKEGELCSINFMPQGIFLGQAKTYFMLSRGKIKLQEEREKEKRINLKGILPLYPTASAIASPKGANFTQTAYTTKDDIGQVVSFYKSRMPDYGWSLLSEEPIKKKEITASGVAEVNCPSCPKNSARVDSSQDFELWQAELGFSNQKGDTCQIAFDHAKSRQEQKTPSMTIIWVSYAENQ